LLLNAGVVNQSLVDSMMINTKFDREDHCSIL
jgi:hypothetical protein